MSVDANTVRRVACLARIAVTEEEAPALCDDLNRILDWIEQLSEVDVEGAPPMTSVCEQPLYLREDRVADGGDAARVLANAPERADDFFVVPKVVE